MVKERMAYQRKKYAKKKSGTEIVLNRRVRWASLSMIFLCSVLLFLTIILFKNVVVIILL